MTVYDGAATMKHTLQDPEQWEYLALCAQTDPEVFFPNAGGSTREAKKICLRCEVCNLCLEKALANRERFGVWGALSAPERRHLLRDGGSGDEPHALCTQTTEHNRYGTKGKL